MRVSVIGGSEVDDEIYELAVDLGRQLAGRGHAVVCGGLGGTMEAVCRGARLEDGETIGILPGERRTTANRWVTTPIATGLGNARNAIVVLNGDAAIAIDGATGTLSEIALALDYGRPVAGLDTHSVDLDGFQAVDSPAAAIDSIEERVRVGD